MGESKKPQLKPIGSIVGIGGKREVHAYLSSIIKAIGIEEDSDGLPMKRESIHNNVMKLNKLAQFVNQINLKR